MDDFLTLAQIPMLVLREQVTPDHILKTWPAEFEEVLKGQKTFEYRKNDRGFRKWDSLLLMEWDASRPNSRALSGRWCWVEVTSILHGPTHGVPESYCVMSIQKIRHGSVKA